jgi:uncharacterized membrane protein YkgB
LNSGHSGVASVTPSRYPRASKFGVFKVMWLKKYGLIAFFTLLGFISFLIGLSSQNLLIGLWGAAITVIGSLMVLVVWRRTRH